MIRNRCLKPVQKLHYLLFNLADKQ